ncbi:MAG: nuclear transport factor 2 family protein [Oceanospirillaceae bacterium]|nr:nuclear transport factor 2 family protein [Oceanospirillaceae bacterium]
MTLPTPEQQEACERLVLEAAFRADQQDYEGLAALFAEDAQLYRPSAPQTPLKGRDAILNSYLGRPATRITRHLCSNFRFSRESADCVRVRCYVQLYASSGPAEAGDPFGAPLDGKVLIGELDDLCRNDGEGWRIAERRACFVLHGE